MRKSKPKETDDSFTKTFLKYVHRYYYLVDTTPDCALMLYCSTLRKSKIEAVEELAKVTQEEIASMEHYINCRASFEYNNPLEDKINYIKELRIQLWKDTTTS